MGHIAFKFVKWDVPELATLKDSRFTGYESVLIMAAN